MKVLHIFKRQKSLQNSFARILRDLDLDFHILKWIKVKSSVRKERDEST